MHSMSMRTLLIPVLMIAMIAGVAWADQVSAEERQDETPRTEETDRAPGLGITVIRLKWANAEELAATLRPILPEGYKVIAYPSLNALIITRDPAALQSPRR